MATSIESGLGPTKLCDHCEGLMPDVGADFCSDECAEKSAKFRAECERRRKYGEPTLARSSAFARSGFTYTDEDRGHERIVEAEDGLTKREYFAAMAMQGLLANTGDSYSLAVLAADAVENADALIEALNREQS